MLRLELVWVREICGVQLRTGSLYNEHNSIHGKVVHVLVAELVKEHVESLRIEIAGRDSLFADSVEDCPLIAKESNNTLLCYGGTVRAELNVDTRDIRESTGRAETLPERHGLITGQCAYRLMESGTLCNRLKAALIIRKHLEYNAVLGSKADFLFGVEKRSLSLEIILVFKDTAGRITKGIG